MLVYKQRYKPRTSRAFTKSDLTVYDSAGNTALNALTVYGKSEVVDGSIKSAGEGWATVRLADLTWSIVTIDDYSVFFAPVTNMYQPTTRPERMTGILCDKYKITTNPTQSGSENKSCYRYAGEILIKDNDYTTVEDFVASLGDATLCYELADPTQGNCIAVKTDNGSGIDGTMAVFETGTPLRGIPDTDVRDVMQWDGSSGEVTKNCAKDRLANLTWTYNTNYNHAFFMATLSIPTQDEQRSILSSNYIEKLTLYDVINTNQSYCIVNNTIRIRDDNYTTVSDFVASLGDAELVYKRATPTTEQLTTTENDSIAGLRTFEPQTHAQNNAGTDMTVDYTIRVPTI